MEEAKRLSSLFEKLYDGYPWLGVNLLDTLQKLDANQASQKTLPYCNSIWEITNHLIHWRLNVLERVQDKVLKTPSNNYVEAIKNTSNEAWLDTLQRLELTQNQWLHFLKTVKTEDLEKKYPVNNMTYYEQIHGIIQHDAYHLGQIVLLSKLV